MRYPITGVSGKSLLITAAACWLFSGNVWAQSNDKIQWSITPYLWAANTTVDLRFRDTDLGGGEISFKDLLDVVDTSFMVHVEGGKGNWSMFSDLAYLKTSDTSDRPPLTVGSRNKQTNIDAALAYWPGGVGSPLSLYGGLRYSGFNDRYRFNLGDTTLVERHTSKDYYDALLGLRYRFDLSERWSLLTRSDLSFGGSKGTFLLQANFAYTVGKRQQNRIMFGYQYKQAKFKDGDLTSDFSYYGPMAGFNFRF